MYAIIQTGGKQVRAEIGQEIYIEKVEAEAGEQFEFTEILMVGGDKPIIGTPLVKNAKVVAEVIKHGRGKKIIVFKYNRRKNYRRKQGHRQAYTKLVIKEIIA